MKPVVAFFSVLWVLALAGAAVIPVFADDGTPPANGDSTWDPIVNDDGTVDVSGLTDLGVQEVSAEWMPDIPVFGNVPATYHLYQDPASGTIYMLPTATTYLFMAANPDESGLSDAIGALSGNAENSSGYATDAAFLAGIVSGNLDFSDYQQFIQAGYSDWNDLFEAIVSGETDIWSLPMQDTFNFLYDMIQMSISEGNFYAVILAFPPGMCDEFPGGCPEGMADSAGDLPSDVIYDNPSCPAPFTTTGAITVSGGPGAGDGGKLAPDHPIVVGQDPGRRGVDVQAQVHIPLITYHYYETVFHQELLCVQDPDTSDTNTGCSGPAEKYGNGAGWTTSMIGNNLYTEKIHIWSTCVEHAQDYVDQLASATISVVLTQESRQWILTSLEQAYPGAHLKHPSFSYTLPGPGMADGSGVTWLQIVPGIPIEDPGYWAVSVRVLTTGTPVSGPRSVTIGLGQFLDELVRVTLADSLQP